MGHRKIFHILQDHSVSHSPHSIEFLVTVHRRPQSANHPHVVVYNQDCNTLLKHKVEGKGPLYSIDGEEQLPPLPSPGEVDLIIGGPPCQAFSGMNRYKVRELLASEPADANLTYLAFSQSADDIRYVRTTPRNSDVLIFAEA